MRPQSWRCWLPHGGNAFPDLKKFFERGTRRRGLSIVTIFEGSAPLLGALAAESDDGTGADAAGALPHADRNLDALEDAASQHARLLYRIAYAVVKSHDAAEDVVQETFLRAVRFRAKLANVRNLRSWLIAIAWRVAVDRRRRSPETNIEDFGQIAGGLHGSEPNIEKLAADRELLELTTSLIEKLPPKLRDPLLLSSVQQLTTADISAALGIPEGSVRNRVMRARQLLKSKLAAVMEKEKRDA